MKKIPKPKFAKVDDNTIRITVENAQDVPLIQVVDNRKRLVEQKEELKKDFIEQEKRFDMAIKGIDEVLIEAKRLGIVAKLPIEPKPPAIRKIKEGEEGRE